MLTAATLLTGIVVAQKNVQGSGNTIQQDRNTAPFSGVTVGGGMKVIINNSPTPSIRIEAEDNIVPLVTTEVKDGQLIIGYKPKISINTHRQVTVYLSCPVLNSAKIAGSGSIISQNALKSDGRLETTISGSGSITLQVNAEKTIVQISGSGNVTFTGNNTDLNVDISGSGKFSGYNFVSRNADVKISGSGNVELKVDGKLNATISGSGDVFYKGNAQINARTSGSGKIRKTDN